MTTHHQERCPAHTDPPGRPDPDRIPRRSDVEVDRAAAVEFLALFHAENPEAGPMGPRLAAVMREIDMTGTYWHTAEELAFGARAAWRNNARCIGRLYWQSLHVRDLRTVADAGGVAEHCFEHLREAHNGGKIRPVISVFAPETPTRRAPRIWNEQLIRYAGYEQPDGGVLGDPRYRTFTNELIRRGWRPPELPGAFDVLPLVVETVEEGPRMFEVPDQAVHEVQLEHPELAWFADLGMRWHAVPVISNSRLVIGVSPTLPHLSAVGTWAPRSGPATWATATATTWSQRWRNEWTWTPRTRRPCGGTRPWSRSTGRYCTPSV
jgi:nitric-oxide synthase